MTQIERMSLIVFMLGLFILIRDGNEMPRGVFIIFITIAFAGALLFMFL